MVKSLKYYPMALRILSVILLFFLSSCKSTITNTKNQNTTNQREYNWDVDTLLTYSTTLWRIGGYSSNNVYAVGNGGDSKYYVWHFNGIKWSTINLGNFGMIVPYGVFALNKNSIFIAGDDGVIWKGDGVKWSEVLNYQPQGHKVVCFNSIWGDSEDNVFAMGMIDTVINGNNSSLGLILHYDGVTWKRVYLPSGKFGIIHQIIRSGNNNQYFITGVEYTEINDNRQYLLKTYVWDGSIIKEINSFMGEGSNFIGDFNKELIFILNNKMYRYLNNNLNEFYFNKDMGKYFCRGGRNIYDMYFTKYDEGIFQFNGIDFECIYHINPDVSIYDMIVFEKEIFLLANDNNKPYSYIIRGTQK